MSKYKIRFFNECRKVHSISRRMAVILCGVMTLQAAAQSNYNTPYSFTTLAGTALVSGPTDGTGSAARFGTPQGMAFDSAGNLYVADSTYQTIRKIAPGGVVTTIAGVASSSGSTDGLGNVAKFNQPKGVAVDGAGNLYVADRANHTIRKITMNAGVVTVTTLAGSAGNSGFADGTGSAARFRNPEGLAVDTTGNVYVADSFNNLIRKITPGGVVTTLAGAGFSFPGSLDGIGIAAQFNHPLGLAIDGAGNVYVSDSSNVTIRKITPGGVVTTLAGLASNPGSGDGMGAAARFGSVTLGVTVDGSGNVYVAEHSYDVIRKITPGGVVTTLGGSVNVSGSTDAAGIIARFNDPTGLAIDGLGNLYIADSSNNTIRKGVPPSGPTITTQPVAQTVFAGASATFSIAVGAVPSPTFQWQKDGVNISGATSSTYSIGSVAEGDAGSYRVVVTTSVGPAFSDSAPLMLYAAPTVTLQPLSRTVALGYPVAFTATAAGYPAPAYQWKKNGVNINGATNASYTIPGVLLEDAGIYTVVATNSVSSITSDPAVLTVDAPFSFTTLAGSVENTGSADGTGSAAQFSDPLAVTVDGAGNVYVADSGNNVIRKISPSGIVTTLAGTAGVFGSADGVGGAAQFNFPVGVAVDGAGNVYVADLGNNMIRKVTAAGVVTTLAGQLDPGAVNGNGSVAQFNYPRGLAVDGAGNVYVADYNNNMIRKITSAGVVTTLAGSVSSGSADGTGVAAQFNGPSGVAVDGAGNVYVADSVNSTIRKITSAGVVTTVAGTPLAFGDGDGIGAAARFNFPTGVSVDGAGNVYVADSSNDLIRKITPNGTVITIGGLVGNDRFANGTGIAAWFRYPDGIAVDGAGRLYVADAGNSSIRKGVVAFAQFAPVITEQPASQTVGVSFPVSWRVVANGVPSPTYQWKKNGVNINGATGSSYGLGNVSMGDAGTYTVVVSNTQGTVTSAGASLSVVAFNSAAGKIVDFNGDGKADILWEDSLGGSHGMWLMNGTAIIGWVDLGQVPPPWHMVAAADFNGDGKSDILWEDSEGGSHGIWLMNGTAVVGWVDLGQVPPPWHMVAAADFNGDGKTDILWEDSAGGSHGVWLMNGTAVVGWTDLGQVPPPWHMVAAADFNGDGKTDILWEEPQSGSHGVWLMNGTAVVGWTDLGQVPPPWHMVTAGDFNGDGKTDILWEDPVSGSHGVWLMNGTAVVGWADMGLVPAPWHMVP